jgi:hypothetical protein
MPARPASADIISLEFTQISPTTVTLGEHISFFAALSFLTEPTSSTQVFPQNPVFEPEPQLGEQMWVSSETVATVHGLEDVRFSLHSPELGFLGSLTHDAQGIFGKPAFPFIRTQTVGQAWDFLFNTPGVYEFNLTTLLLGREWTDTTITFRTRNCDPFLGCTDWGPVDLNTTTDVASWSQPLGNLSLTFRVVDEIHAVPEPTTLALLGAGLFGFAATRRRRAADGL